jgi:dUTP pyrophosphatase
VKVRITKIRPDAVLPKYETPGACCFDIVCVEDDVIQPKEIKLLPTGLVVCVPDGYMLMVASRSSTPRKKGLQIIQGIGILDQDYCGPEDELKLQVYNYTDQPVEVKKGDRVYQAGFVRIDRAEWDEGPTVSEKTRGGFGSTGH